MSNYIGCCKECVYATKGEWDCECRRHPPKCIDGSLGSIDMFPLVSTSSWCGEFKKKEQEYVKKDKTEFNRNDAKHNYASTPGTYDGCYTTKDIQA